MRAWAQVNPTLLRGGEVTGPIPALSWALSQEVAPKSLADGHMHFDLWVRQIGFATFPWIALIPTGLAYLSRAARGPADEEPIRPTRARRSQALQRLLLLWAFAGAGVAALGSYWGHHYYPAYFPLAAACGIALAIVEFWRRAARERPLICTRPGSWPRPWC